jgi:hypothetical protein
VPFLISGATVFSPQEMMFIQTLGLPDHKDREPPPLSVRAFLYRKPMSFHLEDHQILCLAGRAEKVSRICFGSRGVDLGGAGRSKTVSRLPTRGVLFKSLNVCLVTQYSSPFSNCQQFPDTLRHRALAKCGKQTALPTFAQPRRLRGVI